MVIVGVPAPRLAQSMEQYERKVLPTIVELVVFALSRNQRYQDAVV